MELQTAILLGGLGSRVASISKKKPKALVDINGKPFIDWQLNYLKKQGFKNIIMCVGHMSKQIIDFVGNGERYNLKIEYSDDGEKLLGTGGSIKKALPLLNQSFFILYGDSFLPINYIDVEKIFLKKQNLALMTIIKNSNKWDKSNVHLDGSKVNYNKKYPNIHMKHIDYGLSVVNASVFDNYKEIDKFDLSDVFYTLSKDNLLRVHEIKKRFYEIGSVKGLEDTIKYFKKDYNNVT